MQSRSWEQKSIPTEHLSELSCNWECLYFSHRSQNDFSSFFSRLPKTVFEFVLSSERKQWVKGRGRNGEGLAGLWKFCRHWTFYGSGACVTFTKTIILSLLLDQILSICINYIIQMQLWILKPTKYGSKNFVETGLTMKNLQETRQICKASASQILRHLIFYHRTKSKDLCFYFY